jgi:hypothetical protein
LAVEARSKGQEALTNIEESLKGMTVGRVPVASTEVRPVRPFLDELELKQLRAFDQFYHGTRSTVDPLTVDFIRGGSTSATGRGLHVTLDSALATHYATKPVNVDLPESTVSFIGDPRVLEIMILSPLSKLYVGTPSDELSLILSNVKKSFPELADTGLDSLGLPDALNRVREAVSPEVAREFEIHVAEALRDAGVDVLVSRNRNHFHILDTGKLAVTSSTPKSVLMSASELAQADALARSTSRAVDEFEHVDSLHSLHRYVNQELQAISQTEAYLASKLDDTVDKTKLWDYNGTPENIPTATVPDPTPPPASNVPWESSDSIGPCLL